MAEEWYYARNGKSFGPFVRPQLQEFATSGTLRTSDMVWKNGMSEWKPADAVKGLFPSPKATPRGAGKRQQEMRPLFSLRTFLTGAGCGLAVGLLVGLLAIHAPPPREDGREEEGLGAKLTRTAAQVVEAGPAKTASPVPEKTKNSGNEKRGRFGSLTLTATEPARP